MRSGNLGWSLSAAVGRNDRDRIVIKISGVLMCGKRCLALLQIFFFGFAVAGTGGYPEYIGRKACADCHADQVAQWSGSHHDLAMQPASEETVLGDFDNASLTRFEQTSLFFREDGRFMVRTEGTDGKISNYPIKFTFGVEPLQQYLIEFPGGRLQALSLAWDTRPKKNGGQRWFHLYPDERITHDDELHWTRPSQNWNSMCAECHSTHLEKKYNPLDRTFTTTWSEIDVSCEACHGPGAGHVAWAGQQPELQKNDPDKGLVLKLNERRDVSWTMNPATGTAIRSSSRRSDKEIEMCARCHARRSPINHQYIHGQPLMDHYLPRLLDEGMYYADGQINDEVYVYGSFIQSKMYRAGVTCSDCHEPHSLALRAPGNGVCLQCHSAAKFDQSSHHFHQPDSAGGSCTECHMPPKTYMVVDPRHDHSMRVPRPYLSVTLGVPNACTNCHAEQSAEWAAEQVKAWYGKSPGGYQTYASALAGARSRKADAGNALLNVIRDKSAPDIARATALAGFSPYLGPETIGVIVQSLEESNPIIRAAALRALESAPVEIRATLVFEALDDPVRAVRIEAARMLAPVSAGDLSADQQSLLDKGVQEYIDAQLAMAERPEAQANLGSLYAALGKGEQAVNAYQTSLEIDQAFTPAYVNLADFYRARGAEAEAEKILRHAAGMVPGSADIQHALGLSLVRQKRTAEAIEALERAARLSPDNSRYVFVYAVGLNSTGKTGQAVTVLQGAHHRFPDNTDILTALIAFHRDTGNLDAARIYAEKLRSIAP